MQKQEFACLFAAEIVYPGRIVIVVAPDVIIVIGARECTRASPKEAECEPRWLAYIYVKRMLCAKYYIYI